MQFKTKYAGPWADNDKFLIIKTGEWRHQRPITNADKCHRCGTCYFLCPGGSIVDKGTYFAADLNYCKGCGVCAKVCPSFSIIMVPER